MRSAASGALIVPFFIGLAACSAVQPRLGTDERPTFDDDRGMTGPFPSPASIPGMVPDDTRPAIDRVCRTGPMPAGYVAIDYALGGRDCPKLVGDGDNRFTAAVIERYTDKTVGAIMFVCADQPVPSGWVRESEGGGTTACEGARVGEDEPTTYSMRRLREA
ncbi:MAG: hypothetical protein WEF86_01290 [Gemmatimonadota bacterium]